MITYRLHPLRLLPAEMIMDEQHDFFLCRRRPPPLLKKIIIFARGKLLLRSSQGLLLLLPRVVLDIPLALILWGNGGFFTVGLQR